MDKNELHGTLVLVHPGLENDPAGRQGKVGILDYISDANEIFVSFADNAKGKYAPNAILQLKDRQDLFPRIGKDAVRDLELNDYKDLFKISKLQDLGRSTDIVQALEIAGNNPAIWSKALQPLENSIPIRMHQTLGR